MMRVTSSLTRHVGRTLIASIAIAAVIAAASLFSPRPAAAAVGVPAPVPAVVAASEESSETTSVPVPLPLPLQMRSVGRSRQLIIATGARLGATTGTLQFFDKVGDVWVKRLSVPARFGKRGLIDGLLRKAGNNTTPTGIWLMPDYVFGTHRLAPSGTKMKYRRMTRNTWWSSKRGTTYNRWVEARSWKGEHIGRSPKAYEFAVSMGYNARPNRSVFGRGTGIFLHVRGTGLTAGCVAISRADMIRVCRLLDRTKRPRFAVGTLQRGTTTSIWAY